MHLLKSIIFVLFIFFFTKSVQSQKIDSLLLHYTNKVSYEKLYIHFDNERYIPGQTIWYKGYLMTGFQPSQISKNLYVDWYNENGKLVGSSISPIVYSFSNASFTIPNDYDGKKLHAIAYTKWMRNFDSSYFYHHSFTVVSKYIGNEIVSKTYTTSLQLLPESGQLISGKINVIAFKAVNSFGLPEKIQGIVKNSKGDSITSFKTLHNGMGKFQFIPNSTEVYTAVWKDLLGMVHQTSIPEAQSIGVNFYLESGKTNRLFHVQRTYNVPTSMKQLTMVGQMNGIVQFMTNINLVDRESLTSMLPISKLPTGILQITLLDADQKPICERLLFVKNEDYKLNTEVVVDSLNTSRRGRNVISISLKDTTLANFSVSITDANSSVTPSNSIVSQLLLQGDLVGNIFEPNYYFSTNADSVYNHLDLVMLTNGWRRYVWNDIFSNTENPQLLFSKDIAFQSIKGTINDYTNRKSRKQDFINLIIVSKDSSTSMLTLPILEDGSFESPNALLYDTTRVYYKLASNGTVNDNSINIGNDLYKADPNAAYSISALTTDTIGLYKYQLLAKEIYKFDSLNKSNTLKEVVVVAKQKSRLRELDVKYATGIFSGQSTAAFDMSDIKNVGHSTSIFDFLTGRVPGLTLGNDLGGLATEGVVSFRGGTPNFYLNELPIATSDLPLINMNSVAYIKVFNPPFAGGMNNSIATTKSFDSKGKSIVIATGNSGSGAAIVIYTKKGSDIGESYSSLTNGMNFKTYIGYAAHKEFYSPVYAEKENSMKIEDVRSTLYWNPWIDLDKKNQKSRIIFYNNDISNTFRLTIEGMDHKGKLFHYTRMIQ